jgi:RND family efflux transporter MFP subunit
MDIKVDVGDEVKSGQLLASIDAGVLKDKLQQARREVSIQKKTLAYQERRNEIYNRDQRSAQEAAVEKAQAAVDEILRELQYVDITAPMDGVIAEKNINLGEIAQAGSPVVKIIKKDEMRIEAKVPEVDIAGVKEGQKTSAKFDAYPENQRFEAVVTDIDPAPVIVENVSYYVVKMNVVNPDPGFKYGMSCTVYDETNRKDNVIMIPKWAIRSEGNKKFITVMVNAEENAVEKRDVQIGLEGDNGMAEVVSGLKEGEQIATEK